MCNVSAWYVYDVYVLCMYVVREYVWCVCKSMNKPQGVCKLEHNFPKSVVALPLRSKDQAQAIGLALLL